MTTAAGPRDRWVEPSPRLHLAEWHDGSSPTVLLLHGATQHARVWDAVARALDRYHVLALDTRGHGHSEWAGSGGYTAEQYVGDLERVVDALGPETIAIVGHSTGALISMIYAARHPQRLWATAFVDIDPRPPDSQPERLREAGSRPVRRFESMEAVQAGVARVTPGVPEAMIAHLAESGYARHGDGTFVQRFDPLTLAEFPQFDNRPLLPTIPGPALVVRGEQSTVSSEQAAIEAAQALPRGRLVRLPGEHQLHLQHPEELAHALGQFLDEFAPTA